MRTFVVLLNDSVVCVVTAASVWQAEGFAHKRFGDTAMVLEAETYHVDL